MGVAECVGGLGAGRQAEARRDLVYTSMSISRISFRLGFADPAYFSRFFARRAGVSPSDYRAKA